LRQKSGSETGDETDEAVKHDESQNYFVADKDMPEMLRFKAQGPLLVEPVRDRGKCHFKAES